jgi:hypothetical protein
MLHLMKLSSFTNSCREDKMWPEKTLLLIYCHLTAGRTFHFQSSFRWCLLLMAKIFHVMHFVAARQIFSRWCILLTPDIDISFLHCLGKDWYATFLYLYVATAKRTLSEAVVFLYHYVNVIDRSVMLHYISWGSCHWQKKIWCTLFKSEPSTFFL